MWRLPITLTAADFNAGLALESWCCVDCGVNTAPGCSTRAEVEAAYNDRNRQDEGIGVLTAGEETEMYHVRDRVWKAAGMEPLGGCLCIGCLEERLGRKLKPKDFTRGHPFNEYLPGSQRLLKRQKRRVE